MNRYNASEEMVMRMAELEMLLESQAAMSELSKEDFPARVEYFRLRIEWLRDGVIPDLMDRVARGA